MALILIRHGQTDANLEKRIQGTNPDPLNTVGIQQAHACAQRLYDYFKANNKSIAAIKTSDIVRAKQTTDIIHSVLSQHFGKISLEQDQRLREKYRGRFQGRTKNQIDEEAIKQGFSSKDEFFEMQEDVEKLHETKKRVSDFLSELEEVYTGNSSTLLHSHDIIVVSHSQLLKTLIEHIEQKPLHEIQDFYIPQLKRHKIHNASVTIYDYVSGKGFQRILANNIEYLDTIL